MVLATVVAVATLLTLRQSRTTEITNGLSRDCEVNSLLEGLRMLLPNLAKKVRLQTIDVVMNLISIAHVEDGSEGGLEYAGVRVHRMVRAHLELADALACEHGSLHWTITITKKVDELTPVAGTLLRRHVLPPHEGRAIEVRDSEHDARAPSSGNCAP